MRRDELDDALVRASPIREADLRNLDLSAAESELLEEITSHQQLDDSDRRLSEGHRGRRLRPPRRTRGLLVGTVSASIAAAAAIVWLGSIGGADGPAFAASAIKVAEANPRLLVTEPGWSVTRADEFRVDEGEMTFSDGEHTLDLNWYRARSYESYFNDRTEVDPTPTTLELFGETARVVHYAPSPDFAAMLPPQGKTFLEIRGNLGSEERYLEVVRSLKPTDVETWLSAMPESVVRPIDRSATVDEMLAGLPLPPGLDVRSLRDGTRVLDRYQLGAQVSGAVACGWLTQWTDASSTGDDAGVDEAVEAMSTARTWPVLREMAADGAYPEFLWELADLMEVGKVDSKFRGLRSGVGCAKP